MTHEELRELINMDLAQPQPDPAWDYYTVWNKLIEVRNELTQLISFVAQHENANREADSKIYSTLNGCCTQIVSQMAVIAPTLHS